jgi:hypothetical protein
MTTKSRFDYSASAELYFGKRTTRFRSIRYLRFETSAEALRYLVEDMPAELLSGAILETEEHRLQGSELTALYHHKAYPLARA